MLIGFVITGLIVVAGFAWLRYEVGKQVDRKIADGCPLLTDFAAKVQEMERTALATQTQAAHAIETARAAEAQAREAMADKTEEELLAAAPPTERVGVFRGR